MEALFSYGTLQQTQVQLDTFGRELDGSKDTLIGYTLGEVTITDPKVVASSGKSVHPILIHTGSPTDHVNGTVFLLTDDELTQADNYEVDEYVRVQAHLASGKRCWIYAAGK
ncbi:gamma-glutamylcyclotransferase [Pseudoalteromonas sp. JBTF-M23]|uniref:Gamma-glutamylcyclotransferase n=1 Tax=Pseudoalteromonas caenipelagi TaxID=2726988 RepID=A0A849VDQ2_9GAMM|nr:gamma-glutamylcyclotransferase family protein [Pseudoalteromonas caenipelagi]NOU49867.1 gamma-glutamylcyclotransferase [Pseudoalteromonas caenipelagi]